MLRELQIDNVAIIESLRVQFTPGLNVLSGETGAGKSIVFASLGLVLGARASVELVRTGARQAQVTARFSLAPRSPARDALKEFGIQAGEELELRRVLLAKGAGKAFINGKAVRVAQLRQVAAGMVDRASQHQHQALLDPDEHLRILDRTARAEGLLEKLAGAWATLGVQRKALRKLQDTARHLGERAEVLRFQLRELDALDLQPDEEQELLTERRVQRHAVELGEGFRKVEGLLQSNDNSAIDQLAGAENALQRMKAVDPRLEELSERLSELLVGVEDLAHELGGREVEHDPQRLDEIEGRLSSLERLKRKHRCEADSLIALRAELAEQLEGLDHVDERIAKATRKVERARDAALKLARALRRERMKAAAQLEERVVAQLRQLAMPHAVFRVVLMPLESGEPLLDGSFLGEQGLERAEFHLSANPGEQPRCLARVASGGELSRILLAVRIAAGDSVASYLLDEVDSGIGGVAAEQVGRKLAELAGGTQVLCITHLPQIASLADSHFAVSKHVQQGRTRSTLQRLDTEGRVLELARMVGGSPDAASVSYARELLRGYARVA